MKLFWKIFISFMLVIITSSLISGALNLHIAKNSSSNHIDKYIDEIIDFQDNLSDLIEQEKINTAYNMLLNSNKLGEQFLVFDDFGDEILGREENKRHSFNSKFKQNLTLEFKKRNLDLFKTIQSIDGNFYFIEVKPNIHHSPFLSPTIAGKILRIIILVILSAFVCYLITKTITKRISMLQQATKQINKGNYSLINQLNTNSKDELNDLFRDFKLMAQNLEKNEQSKQQTLSDISHELRSPLARIKVALTITQESFPETEQQIQRIDNEVNQMDSLIDQIITIQKLQIAKQLLTPKLITKEIFITLLESIIKNVNYEFQKNNKKVVIQGSDDLKNFDILINETYLISAFENIIRNATSHTKENSTVIINIQNKEKHILIKIIDKGNGINTKQTNDIFEPFFREDSSRNRTTGGYGLGLSIAKAIIENHNGTIKAYNNLEISKGLEIITGLVVEIRLPKK